MIEEAHMGRLFEELLVEQCAPTLTGLKPASLFRYQADDRIESVQAAMRQRVEGISCCGSSLAVCVWKRSFPMKSASFWATRWRMWRASSATGEEIFRSAATGRSMETRRRLRSSLRDTAAVRFTVWNSSEAAYPLST